jgi:TRAP-type mannitol/chloroaromatic compound transport system permease small subunit
MQRLSGVLSRLALGLLLLGTVGMIASMLIGVADVVGTKFFDWPVPGTLEFTESTMVLVVFGALAYAQERRAHIRVELLYGHVGPRGQSFMEAVTHIVAFIFFVLVAWQGLSELLYSWELKEATMGTVRFPLYPARFFLLLGVLLLLVRLALDIVVDIGRMRRGEAPPATSASAATE